MNSQQNPGWDGQVERLHQGRLTPQDAAVMRSEAKRRGEEGWLEGELALEAELARIERPVVSSNFTAQVLQAIERDVREEARRPQTFLARMLRGMVWPRLVGAGVAVVAMAVAVVLQNRATQRLRLAEDLVQVVRAADASQAAKLSPVETFQDFEAIQLSAPRVQVDYVGLVGALSE
jgi:hypothetical protein